MRIFEILGASANSALPLNETWRRNLYEPLVDLGHDVFLLPADEGGRALRRDSSRLAARFTSKLVDTFRREHAKKPFDLVFAYLIDGMVDAQGIADLKRYGVPLCNFSCNNAHQFNLVSTLAPLYDFNLHAEKDAASKFRAVGANPVWWPMASNPKYFRPMALPRNVNASFVGGNYGVRARLARRLLDEGIDLQVYGPGWRWGASTRLRSAAKHWAYRVRAATGNDTTKARWRAELCEHDVRQRLGSRYPDHVHAPVSDEELIALYSKSRLSLGILDVHDGHDPTKQVLQHMHLREFEAPMCGALYLTGFTDELAECFEPDSEVLVYRDIGELIDKTRFYLRNPEAGERIRHAGRRRALSDHTYHQRFEQLFSRIGLQTCHPKIAYSSPS